MFISEAFAQAADSSIANAPWASSAFQIVALVAIFYFLLIRPQSKKNKQLQEMIASLGKGDRVVTVSGMIGTITKVEEEEKIFVVEIAPQVKVKILQSAVTGRFGDSTVGSNDNKSAKSKGTAKETPAEEMETPAAS